jgi:hypothetical protein
MRSFLTLAAGALTLALAACGDMSTEPQASSPTTPRLTTTSTLTVTSLQCYDLGGGGSHYNETECYASASGGTGYYTWSWDVIVTSGDENSPYITGVCTDPYYRVTVTVTDSSGATASLSKSFPCYALSDSGIEP